MSIRHLAVVAAAAAAALSAFAVEEPFGAMVFNPPVWKEGQPQWPSLTKTIPEADWSGYDRLVMDITEAGSGGDLLKCFIAPKKGPIQAMKQAFDTILRTGKTVRWVMPLDKVPPEIRSHVARVHLFVYRPFGMEARILRTMLLRKGETPPPLTVDPDLPAIRARHAAEAERRAAEKRQQCRAAKAAFAEKCRAAGQSTRDFLIGAAPATVCVRPREPVDVAPASSLAMRLAGGEHENLQLLVMSAKGGLRNVKVSATQSFVTVAPIGYVETRSEPPYTILKEGRRVKPEVGWWPDPVLDFLPCVDVAEDDVQGFLVRAHAPAGFPAGTYKGELVVSADGARPVALPFTVRVNAFSLPSTPPYPLAITFRPGSRVLETELSRSEIAALRKSPDYPVNAWCRHREAWCDFLADYGITYASIYAPPDFDMLRRLKAQGRLGVFNLGYWTYPTDLSDAAKRSWTDKTLAPLKAAYAAAKAEGMLDHAYVYGSDEVSKEYFPNIRWAVQELKRALPGVPISTTAYDDSFGVDSPLDGIDWFTPQPNKYVPAKAAASRAAGHRVWWYFACSQTDPDANLFVEYPLLPVRLFMGVQAVKHRPDGFLYYQCSIWNATNCITSGPYTTWNPRSFKNYHGDGAFTAVGPDGTPLATLRLEAFRDGLEDAAYAKLLEARIAARPASDAAWLREARDALTVPDDVAASTTRYTSDPARLEAWRSRIADLLER